jgi:hypothetical protein
MANMLQSSQTTATTAPDWYTKYLSCCIAKSGATAAGNAQYIGATNLQNQAFNNVGAAGNAGNATLGAATGTLGNAAGAQSGLSVGNPNFAGATTCAAQRAQGYMNPYIQCMVNQIGNLGQQNIRQNLAPQATAGAVGSGQFGSLRGAQALGQTMAGADQQILAQQSQALECGYKAALCTAMKQNALCAQVGQAKGTLECAYQRNLIAAGQAQGQLACQQQGMALKGINALATLGCQQRTIAQGAQCYPLQKLTTLANLMKGYTVPTTTKQTMCMSPLSAIASIGSTTAGVLCKMGIKGTDIANWWNKITTGTGGNVNLGTSGGDPCIPVDANGGSIHAARGGSIGCVSTRYMGALPSHKG